MKKKKKIFNLIIGSIIQTMQELQSDEYLKGVSLIILTFSSIFMLLIVAESGEKKSWNKVKKSSKAQSTEQSLQNLEA